MLEVILHVFSFLFCFLSISASVNDFWTLRPDSVISLWDKHGGVFPLSLCFGSFQKLPRLQTRALPKLQRASESSQSRRAVWFLSGKPSQNPQKNFFFLLYLSKLCYFFSVNEKLAHPHSCVQVRFHMKSDEALQWRFHIYKRSGLQMSCSVYSGDFTVP